MASHKTPTFKTLCETGSRYLPPLDQSISPDEQTMDSVSLSLGRTSFASQYSVPVTKDLSGQVKQAISCLARVRDINWAEYHPPRAGVIPYYRTGSLGRGNFYFCLGEDSSSGQLGDFGGGVGLYESSLEGALRELSEESLDIFAPVRAADIGNNIAVTSKQMMIIFLPVPLLPKTYTAMFDVNRGSKDFVEVSNIYWMTEHQLQGLIDNVYPEGRVRLYYKVKTLLEPVFPALTKLL